MRFEILHEIKYEYSRPVFLEPHVFFLRPREDIGQRLLQFEIQIDPVPVLSSGITDVSGNSSVRAWFEGVWKNLTITVFSEVDTVCENPFNYLLENSCLHLPVRYTPLIQQSLGFDSPSEPIHASVAAFSRKIARRVRNDTVAFLLDLCLEIVSSFKKIYRPEGAPWPANLTLEKKEGSCRDLTVLFMECSRSQGLAARFASGYYEGDSKKAEKELHAWAEVYLEGGGWRGFDPSAGLAVGENHVALASAGLPELISPVQGSFRGNEITSKMNTRIQMKQTANQTS